MLPYSHFTVCPNYNITRILIPTKTNSPFYVVSFCLISLLFVGNRTNRLFSLHFHSRIESPSKLNPQFLSLPPISAPLLLPSIPAPDHIHHNHQPSINRSLAPTPAPAQPHKPQKAANSENGDQAAINEELMQTIRRVREAAAEAENSEKVKETPAQDKKFEVKVELPSDQDGQASESENKSAPLDELTLDNDNDDENRNKR